MRGWVCRGTLGLLLCLSLGLTIGWPRPSLAQAELPAASPDSGLRLVDGCAVAERVRFRGLTLRVENDLFAGTDQNYTNGVALIAASHDIRGRLRIACLPMVARLHAAIVRWLNPGFWEGEEAAGNTQNVVVKFGQAMYTPKDHASSQLIVSDRPYAGLLYLGMAWNRRSHAPLDAIEVLDSREITLGIIGPGSYAEQSQHQFHAWVGAPRFQGWKNQLGNEPALQLSMDRRFRPFRGVAPYLPGYSYELIRAIGLRVGNIETAANVGAELRAGWNLPNDFGSYPIRTAAENRAPSAPDAKSGATPTQQPPLGSPPLGGHVFLSMDSKLVAHDFSLDGNLFRSSHHVNRRPWVAQVAAGFAVHGRLAGQDMKLTVMRVFRSREFDLQLTDLRFGSIALSIDFQ